MPAPLACDRSGKFAAGGDNGSSKNKLGARTQLLPIKLRDIYLSPIQLVYFRVYHTRQGTIHQCQILIQARSHAELVNFVSFVQFQAAQRARLE